MYAKSSASAVDTAHRGSSDLSRDRGSLVLQNHHWYCCRTPERLHNLGPPPASLPAVSDCQSRCPSHSLPLAFPLHAQRAPALAWLPTRRLATGSQEQTHQLTWMAPRLETTASTLLAWYARPRSAEAQVDRARSLQTRYTHARYYIMYFEFCGVVGQFVCGCSCVPCASGASLILDTQIRSLQPRVMVNALRSPHTAGNPHSSALPLLRILAVSNGIVAGSELSGHPVDRRGASWPLRNSRQIPRLLLAAPSSFLEHSIHLFLSLCPCTRSRADL